MLTYEECKIAVLMVGRAGGEIQGVDPDGVIMWSLGLSPGKHNASAVLEFIEPGDTLAFQDGVTPVIPAARRAERMRFGPGAYASGANPDFRPSSAETHMRQMQNMLKKIQKQSASLERRQKAVEEIALRREIVEVVEDPEPVPVKKSAAAPDPEPQPEPTPAPAE